MTVLTVSLLTVNMVSKLFGSKRSSCLKSPPEHPLTVKFIRFSSPFTNLSFVDLKCLVCVLEFLRIV